MMMNEAAGGLEARSAEEGGRTCPFYEVEMDTLRTGASQLRHRCLLQPGRPHGPDGGTIAPCECTTARQIGCQAERRHRIARLSSLPSLRAV